MTPQPSRLSISSNGANQLSVSGVIDSHTAGELEAELEQAGTESEVTLDLTGVDFIDSSGLRVIVATHHALDAAGHRLVLDGTSDAVARLLEITGLQEHLHTT